MTCPLRDFPEVDTICRQEAEDTLPALAASIQGGAGPEALRAVAGLAFRDGTGRVELTCLPAVPDLARIPWPDRSGEPASCFGHGIAPLVSSRGCYANCSFCCIAAWHEQTLPGQRYRLREPEDVAAEMAWMQHERGIELFVFHDDNFFLPHRTRCRERLVALADALDASGIGPFATVVKARPTDVREDVSRVLVERLHCVRCYVGIETDADQGLHTLQRWATSKANRDAIEVVRRLDLFVCFNMLRLLDHVRRFPPDAEHDRDLLAELGPVLRREEAKVRAEMEELALRLQDYVGQGAPLTLTGDRVATPLQHPVPPSLEARP